MVPGSIAEVVQLEACIHLQTCFVAEERWSLAGWPDYLVSGQELWGV